MEGSQLVGKPKLQVHITTWIIVFLVVTASIAYLLVLVFVILIVIHAIIIAFSFTFCIDIAVTVAHHTVGRRPLWCSFWTRASSIR